MSARWSEARGRLDQERAGGREAGRRGGVSAFSGAVGGRCRTVEPAEHGAGARQVPPDGRDALLLVARPDAVVLGDMLFIVGRRFFGLLLLGRRRRGGGGGGCCDRGVARRGVLLAARHLWLVCVRTDA